MHFLCERRDQNFSPDFAWPRRCHLGLASPEFAGPPCLAGSSCRSTSPHCRTGAPRLSSVASDLYHRWSTSLKMGKAMMYLTGAAPDRVRPHCSLLNSRQSLSDLVGTSPELAGTSPEIIRTSSQPQRSQLEPHRSHFILLHTY